MRSISFYKNTAILLLILTVASCNDDDVDLPPLFINGDTLKPNFVSTYPRITGINFSPDGNAMSGVIYDSQFDRRFVTLDTTANVQRTLTTEWLRASSGDWGHDGMIVFIMEDKDLPGYNQNVFAIDSSGNNLRRLFNHGSAHGVQFNHAKDSIIFRGVAGDDRPLVIINTDGELADRRSCLVSIQDWYDSLYIGLDFEGLFIGDFFNSCKEYIYPNPGNTSYFRGGGQWINEHLLVWRLSTEQEEAMYLYDLKMDENRLLVGGDVSQYDNMALQAYQPNTDFVWFTRTRYRLVEEQLTSFQTVHKVNYKTGEVIDVEVTF